MNPTSSVSVSGLIQNTLNTGSSIEDCLAELVDNSLGAGATKITITLQTDGSNALIVADNGSKTMNRESLKQSMTLHARSTASDDRPGRFGFGMKQAGISITRHKAATTVISKSQESADITDGLNMITADWRAAVEEDIYYPVPQEITLRGLKLWEDFAIDRHRKGTLIHNICDSTVYAELKEKLGSKDVRADILYKLGIWYYQYLKEGITMTVKVGGVCYPVVAIDPLELNAIPHDNRKTIKCAVMKKGDDVRTYFQDKESWMRYPTTRHQNPLNDMAGYSNIGIFTLTLAYSPTWNEQSYIKRKHFADEAPTAEDMVYLGGLYMKRAKRIIAKEDIKKPGAGDHSLQDMIIRCRGRVEFPTSLDDYFSIMVNKSKMEMDLVHPSIMVQLRKLHGLFVKELHAKYHPKKKDDSSSSDEDTPVVQQPLKPIKPLKESIVGAIRDAAEKDRAENVLVPVVVAQQQQQPIVKITQKPTETPQTPQTPEVKSQPQQQVQSLPQLQPTQIKIRESVRTPPKSEQDILALHHEITKLFPDEHRLHVLKKASPVAAEGLASIYNALQQLKELYEKY